MFQKSACFTTARHDIWDLLSPSLTCLVGEPCGHQVTAAQSRRPSSCLLLAAVLAAAQVWNGLPEAVVSSSSLQTFRRQSFSTFMPSPDLLTV